MRLQNIIIRFDWTLMLTALALTGVGLVVMYGIGISRAEADLFLFQKQFVGTVIGLFLIAACCLLDYRQLRSLALPLYAAGAALLAGVLVFGESIRGTRGWYVIGGLSFQPVEIAKICLILFWRPISFDSSMKNCRGMRFPGVCSRRWGMRPLFSFSPTSVPLW